MEILNILGQNIRFMREKRDFTLLELAERSGYNRFDLSRLEYGEHDVLLSTVIQIAKALDTSFPMLFSKCNDVKENNYYIDDDYFSLFIANIRREWHCAFYKLAENADMEPVNLSRILNKKVVPKIGTIERITNVIGINIEEVFIRKERTSE